MAISRAPRPHGGHVKGAVISEFLSWYDLRFGRSKVAQAIETTGSRFGDELDAAHSHFGVLASSWYPAGLVHVLVDSLIEGWSADEQAARAQDAANVVMAATLRGVYRTMFSLIATPRLYAKHVNRLWRQHYDTGSLVVDELGPTSHQVTYEDWASHHPFICRMNMSSSTPVYTAMRCRDVQWTRVGCISNGDRRCSNVITWHE